VGIRDLLKAAVKKEPERLEREIQEIIAEGEAAGIIDHYSGQMIRNILEFRETVVREIMKPRTEIVALPVEATIHEILELMSNHGYTRMPVVPGNAGQHRRHTECEGPFQDVVARGGQ